MNLIVKCFNELTTEQLYAIYKLRVDVFVVEQNCAYQEIDKADRYSYHVWLEDEQHQIIAYARVIPAGMTFPTVSIGRVIAADRRKGYGTQIVNHAIAVARKQYDPDMIIIEAQVYAKGLYEKCGFIQSSDPFLEDGIPHVQMQLKGK